MFKIKHIRAIGVVSGIILYILISWKAFSKILEEMSKDFSFFRAMVVVLIGLIIMPILLSFFSVKDKNNKINEFIASYKHLGLPSLVLFTPFVLSFMEGNVFLSNQFNPFSFLLILTVMWLISLCWGFKIWLKMWYATFLIFGGMFGQICGLIVLQFYKSFDILSVLLYSGGKICVLLGLIIILQIKLKSFLKERRKIDEKIKE